MLQQRGFTSENAKTEFLQWNMRHSRGQYRDVKVELVREVPGSLWLTTRYRNNIFNSIIDYSLRYPSEPAKFHADWEGKCQTQLMCYWIARVEREEETTISGILTAAVYNLYAIVAVIEKDRKIQKMLDAGEDVEEFLDDDEFEMLEEFKETGKFKQRMVYSIDIRDELYIKYAKNNNVSIMEVSREYWNVDIERQQGSAVRFGIDFRHLWKKGPAIHIISPKFAFDGVAPVKPSGLVVVDGLTPKTWKNDVDIIATLMKIVPTLGEVIGEKYDTSFLEKDFDMLSDVDITNLEKETVRDTARKELEERKKKLTNLGLLKQETVALLTNVRERKLVAVEKTFPRSRATLRIREFPTVLEEIQIGNKVLIPLQIWEQFEKLKILVPIIEIELATGLKTYCGVDGPSQDASIVMVPPIVAKNLLFSDKYSVTATIRGVDPSDLQAIEFRELNTNFYKLRAHDEIVEQSLINYPVVTHGEYIKLGNRNHVGDMIVVSLSPMPCARTITMKPDVIESSLVVYAPYEYIEEAEYDPLHVSPKRGASDYESESEDEL